MSETTQSALQGTVTFVQHHLPGLPAGSYRITVEQQVSTQTKRFANSYTFAVRGERFSLDPGDLFSVYPPDLAEGEFDHTLPHVVFSKQTFPWSRYPTLEPPPSALPNDVSSGNAGGAVVAGAVDHDVPTWLGVLAFDDDDVKAHAGFTLEARSGTVADLFERPTVGTPPRYSYFYKAVNAVPQPAIIDVAAELQYGERATDACRTLDVPLALFWAVAPSLHDLNLTAHVRHLEITKKATVNGATTSRNDLSDTLANADFSIVVGTRFPKTGKRTTAFLVSLEGLEKFLPLDSAASDDRGEVRSPPLDAGSGITIDPNGFVRLIVLKSWTYTSLGDGRHFETLLQRLHPTPSVGTWEPSSDFAMRIFSQPGPSPAPNGVGSAVAMGYTAMRHETRAGGSTVSWYRGPLAPYRVALEPWSTLASSDAALRYDPGTGMFDVSYAAAWQLGRLLALADKHFSVAFYNWRRANQRSVVAGLEAAGVAASLDAVRDQLGADDQLYAVLSTFLPGENRAPSTGANGTTPGLRSSAARARSAAGTLTDHASMTALLAGAWQIPAALYTWLAKLKLLDGVPFTYLVPDERMLPPESIRFFYLDQNWTHALVDGACSIGRYAAANRPSSEHAHDTAAKAPLQLATAAHARTARAALFGKAVAEDDKLSHVVSGFLLRSQVVSGWPGLEVDGYADDGTLLEIVRFERLAPDVLLCLFENAGRALGRVELHEAPESLHFGVSSDEPPCIEIRPINVRGDARAAHAPRCTVPLRSGARVVRMQRLATALVAPQYATALDRKGNEAPLNSCELALELIKGAGLVRFEVTEAP